MSKLVLTIERNESNRDLEIQERHLKAVVLSNYREVAEYIVKFLESRGEFIFEDDTDFWERELKEYMSGCTTLYGENDDRSYTRFYFDVFPLEE